MVAADTNIRFFFRTETRRRAPSSECCREIATIRAAVLGGIFEIDFFDLRFDAILLKSRSIEVEKQLEIKLGGHLPKDHVTAFLMSNYKIILYQPSKWRKRLMNKKG